MPLRFLLDENQRGPFWSVIQHHNARGLDVVDVVRVGDIPELPLGSRDPDILLWCEQNERILISFDRRTLPTHLTRHLNAGRHSPGIFIIDPHKSMLDHLEMLVLIAYATEADEWRDWIKYF